MRRKLVERLIISVLITSLTPVSFDSSPPSHALQSSGSVSYSSQPYEVYVNLNPEKVIGVNNLSLGFQLDGYDIRRFRDGVALRNLAIDANFKLVRFFHHRLGEPCTSWNETTQTGVFNWNRIDPLIEAVFTIGAEPLICFGYYSLLTGRVTVPSGMATDNDGLPRPNSWANYILHWLRHFEEKGYPVRFFEIINEPYQLYFWKNLTELANYCNFWNVVARAMRAENPDIFIGHDASTAKHVLDYWIIHGEDLDFLDFHKYDSSARNPADDAELFRRAESQVLTDYSCTVYTIAEAKEKWHLSRGKTLPVICGEANINWQYSPITDPRIQTMVGATWAALSIRANILWGLDYFLYWNLAGKDSTDEINFGMIDGETNEPYWAYYTMRMIGSNLAVGDSVVESSSSSSDVRTIAWKHNGKLNVLLICKVDTTRTVAFTGIGGASHFLKIDASILAMQSGNINVSQEVITMNGYSIVLLQIPL